MRRQADGPFLEHHFDLFRGHPMRMFDVVEGIRRITGEHRRLKGPINGCLPIETVQCTASEG